jgi:ATP-dependent protease ClpP protease subunit
MQINKNMTKHALLRNAKTQPMTLKSPIEELFSKNKDVYIGDYGNLIEFYLCGEIGDPEDYVEWYHIISNARESDIIKININSPGGNLFTTVQLLQALEATNAHLVMNVAGQCASAATLIFLSGDEYLISEHSTFLFHNYSGGVGGKGGEMYQSVVHQRKWSESLLRKIYSDFLTDDEISHLIDDKDIWMDAETVTQRLHERNDIIEKRQQDQMDAKIEEIEATKKKVRVKSKK